MRRIVDSFRLAVFILMLVAGGYVSSTASADVIIDNDSAGTSFTGTWQISGGAGPYGADSLWSRDGDTYTWRFAVDTPGTYEILMWWTTWPSRSDAVPVDIDGEDGTTRVTINQQQDGSQWNSLGQFQYVTGESYGITLISQPGPTSTNADAVWVKLIEPNEPPIAVIDLISPNPANSGETVELTGHGNDDDGDDITGYQWVSDRDGLLGTSSSLSVSSLSDGSHTISFKVQDRRGLWSQESSQLVVVGTPPTEVIIDNQDPNTSRSGDWSLSGGFNPHATDSFWSRDGSTFTWVFTAPQTGDYRMSMWWTEWASRSTNVPVALEHADGTTQIVVNQQQDGGQWNHLGTFPFIANVSYNIMVTAQPGPSSTCADAVRLEFDATNVPPTAVDDETETSEGDQILIQVLSNDKDTDGILDSDSLAISRNPAHGALVMQSDGSCLYTPTAGYIGTDTFGYTVADDDGAVSNEANVSISVVINQAPTVSDDTAAGIVDQPVPISVLENDFDSDGIIDVASLEVVSTPSHGNVAPGVDGTIVYTPEGGFEGDDSFTYRVADNDGAFSDAAHVTVTIVSDQPPTAQDDLFKSAADTPVLLDILTNDTALDGLLDPASLLVVYGPAHGTVDIQPDGKIEYAPETGFSGEDTFSYTVADYNGQVSNQAVVNIRVVANTIIDNRDTRVSSTGSWSVSGADGFWSTDSVWSRNGDTFTWLFQPEETGSYEVSMWWTQWPSRSTSVPVDIQHADGTSRVVVNQQQNAEQWNTIGQHTFVADTTYRITVTAQPGPSSTCADAVKFDLLDANQPILAAAIGEISPSPAVLGAPVTLRGSGVSTAGAITDYSWRSSLDGQLGDQATLVTSQLSHGTHQVFLKVMDDTGAWSAEAATTVEVVEHIYACFIYDYEPNSESKFISLIQSLGAIKTGDIYQYTNPVGAKTYIHIIKQIPAMIAALKTEGAHVMVKGHSNYGLGPVFPTRTEQQQMIIEDIHFIDDDRILNLSTPWIHVSISGLRTGQAYPYWWPIFKDGTSGIMPYEFDDPRGDPPYNYYISYQVPGSSSWYKAETVRDGAIERFPDSGRPAWFASDGSAPDPNNPNHIDYYIVNDTPWLPTVEVYGSWSEDYRSSTQFKENYSYCSAGSGANQVRWLYTIKQAGDYSVYAWWPSDSGNSTRVPYTVDQSGGSTTIDVDQSRNGGMWVKLGDFNYIPGDYAVTVSDEAAAGRVIADAVRVVAQENPPAVIAADFIALNRNGPAPLEVVFDSRSTGDVTSLYWNFGDGATNTTRDYVTHTYTNPGVYAVTHRVSGPNGSDTVTKSGYITVSDQPVAPLQAEFYASHREAEAPVTINFRDLSSGEIVSREWDFGDGSPVSTLTDPSHTYTTPGNYTATLTVTGVTGATSTERKVNFIVVDILDLSIDNVQYPKRHYRSKTILFRKELEIPQSELRYRRLLYDSCNSGNYYLGTFNRGIVHYTLNNSANLGFYEYIRAYLEGKSDLEMWELMQAAEPVYDFYDFNKPPEQQQ